MNRYSGRQTRAAMAPFAAAQGEKRIQSDYYVEGYAAVFDAPYIIYGDHSEVIRRGVLSGVDLPNVPLVLEHQPRALARTGNGSLIIEEDDKGIFIAADLSLSEAARQSYEEIKNGITDKMSWAFTVKNSTEGAAVTSIDSVSEVFDICLTSMPYSSATSVAARATSAKAGNRALTAKK